MGKTRMLKRLAFLALAAVLASTPALPQGSAVGPPNNITCNLAVQVAVGTGPGVTQVLALNASQIIFICGWHVTNSAASGTFQLSHGTGANCGTGNVVDTPAFTVTSTAPATDHINTAAYNLPKGTALCINPSVNTIGAIIWAAQF